MGPVEVRSLAVRLDIVPTKKLEQSFVHDVNTVHRTVAAADLPEDSCPVEVGPGLDSLTLGLFKHCGRVAAVEIDHRLTTCLPQVVAERAEDCALEFIGKDALKISREDFQTAPDALMANLPYNVSAPVLLHILAELPTIHRVFVVVQSEATDRLAAQPGSKIYGVPSVKAAYYGIVRHTRTIGPRVFWPVPKVNSGLIRINCYARPDASETSDVSDIPETVPWEISSQFHVQLFPLIDVASTQRREILQAALSGIYGSSATAEEALMTTGTNPRQRGEKLEITDFIRLTEASC